MNDDPMAELAYTRALQIVAEQNHDLENLRRQSLGVAGAMGALIAIIVRELSAFPPPGNRWVLVVALTLVALTCMGLVVVPRDWTGTSNVKKMLGEKYKGLSCSQAHRLLAASLVKAHLDNRRRMIRLQTLFNYQLALSVLSVGAWLAIATQQ